jgi:hypothetical protein
MKDEVADRSYDNLMEEKTRKQVFLPKILPLIPKCFLG